MRTHARTILVGKRDVVSADGNETAVSDFELTMQVDQQLGLSAVLGTIASTAKYEDHGMLALQFGKPAAFGGMIREFVIRKTCPGHDVRSHDGETPFGGVANVEVKIP
jgi:hypothetical protein